MRNALSELLLDKPSALSMRCVICGRPATDKHHVIQKGMGGVSKEMEKRIPKVSLCRSCHNRVHSKHLHFGWEGQFVWWDSDEAMSDWRAWINHSQEYKPIRGDI